MLARLLICMLCAAAAWAAAGVCAAQANGAEAQTPRTLIAAHRGSSAHAPENTLSAVLRAVADGADIAEIDVQLAKDGAVVLYHDESLRAHGLNRRVGELRLGQLAALDIGFHFGSGYEGETIPTLKDVITAARGRIRLNIELKPYGDAAALAAAVADIVTAEQFAGQCLVTSFDRQAITAVKRSNPAIRTGLIAASAAAVTPELLSGSVDAVSIKSRAVDRSLVLRVQRHGKELHVWTVNSEREMQRLLRLGVTSIITDDPAKLRALMSRTKAR